MSFDPSSLSFETAFKELLYFQSIDDNQLYLRVLKDGNLFLKSFYLLINLIDLQKLVVFSFLGNFSWLCCRLLTFSILTFSKQSVISYQSV